MKKVLLVCLLVVLMGAVSFSFFVDDGSKAVKSVKYVVPGSSGGFVDSNKFQLHSALRDYIDKKYPSGLIPLPLTDADKKALEKILGNSPGYIVKLNGSSLEGLKAGLSYFSSGLSSKQIASKLAEQKSYLLSAHDSFKQSLYAYQVVSPMQVRREYYQVFNGLSLRNVSLDEIISISRMDSVERIYPIEKYGALLSKNVPEIGATDAWKMNDSFGNQLTGKGIKIAIIDTGIDYTHPDLGGCTFGDVSGANIKVAGVPYSLSSPHPYSPSMNVTWNISMSGYSKIAVHFSRMELEDSFDMLYIKNSSGDVVQELTGNATDLWSNAVDGDTVILNFVSDDNVQDWGFEVDAVRNGSADFGAVGCPKVIDGYDFVNNDNNPMDDQGHGTHCASIAAGNGTLNGVAPGALLMSYKVLDSSGSGYDDDIIAGIEKAVTDGADVISMSLGGTGDAYDAMSQAVDDAVDAGTIVVVAAGNDGPDNMTIDSPGTAIKAITVGASYLLDDPHIVRQSDLQVYFNDTYTSMFSLALRGSAVTTGTLETGLIDAGTGTAEEFKDINCIGKTALVRDLSSYISFHDQVENAGNAGCSAEIIYSPGVDNGTMSEYSSELDLMNLSVIPALWVSGTDGEYLKGLLENASVRLRMNVSASTCPVTEFSSRGPAQIFSKPDILAPGYNICAARMGTAFQDHVGCIDSKHVELSGTSMATPHVAGAAAILLQKNPGWTPLQIKAALKYTARDFGASPTIQGAGLVNISAALALDSPPPVAQILSVYNVSWGAEN